MITGPAAAATAAERGLALFPLPPGGRRPEPGWQRRCTASPDAALRMTAAGNVGVGCRASGVVGLDLDRHPGEPDGIAAFAVACSANGGWPVTLAIRTPSGLHVYFRTPGWPVASGPGPWPGTDIRAPGRRTGGYLVGPGSVVGGRAYAVETDVSIAPLPDWLAELLGAVRTVGGYHAPARRPPHSVHEATAMNRPGPAPYSSSTPLAPPMAEEAPGTDNSRWTTAAHA